MKLNSFTTVAACHTRGLAMGFICGGILNDSLRPPTANYSQSMSVRERYEQKQRYKKSFVYIVYKTKS